MNSEKPKLYYYVENGGDGSAIVRFCESEALANLLSESEDEGFCDNWACEVPDEATVTVKSSIRDVEERIAGGWPNRGDEELLVKLKALL